MFHSTPPHFHLNAVPSRICLIKKLQAIVFLPPPPTSPFQHFKFLDGGLSVQLYPLLTCTVQLPSTLRPYLELSYFHTQTCNVLYNLVQFHIKNPSS